MGRPRGEPGLAHTQAVTQGEVVVTTRHPDLPGEGGRVFREREVCEVEGPAPAEGTEEAKGSR